MITHYASDVSHWENWQKEYRYGVLLIFPPDPPLAQVNALRARYDPQSQATCEAHISLTVPLPSAMSELSFHRAQAVGVC